MSDAFSDTRGRTPRHRLRRRGVRVCGGCSPSTSTLLAPVGRVGDPRPPHPVDAGPVRAGAAGPARPRLAAVGAPHAPDARRGHDRRPAHRGELGRLRRRGGLRTTSPRRRSATSSTRWSPSLIGVVVLRERLRRLQWAAVAVGAGRRHLPHRHLGPAAVDRPRAGLHVRALRADEEAVGASLDALHSLTTETAVLAPIAVGVLIWLELSGATHLPGARAGAPACCWPRPAS